MLLAYIHRTGQEEVPELCFLADKTDQYSVPVSVESLPITNSSVIRLGPHESITVRAEGEALIVSPVKPSKLSLTPGQVDSPGVLVAKVKISSAQKNVYKIDFQQDKDVASGEWRNWNPNENQR